MIDKFISTLTYQFSFRRQCREYGITIWQNPNFLFLIMGGVIISAIIATYAVGNLFINEPELVALITIGLVFILLILAQTIVSKFDQLAKLNKLKSEFISVASHQIRAPLASLKWALDFLINNKTNSFVLGKEKEAEYINILKTSTERMIRLVNDLLDVSRIETNSLKLIAPKKIAIGEIIQSASQNLAALANANNIIIHFDIQPNLPILEGDPERLALAFQNLLDNAIKYTKSKSEIWVKASRANHFISVSIKDNGVGIPANQQKYIFQKFFRSDNIMKHEVVGTGLGLFIARAIIETHKGKISFQSKEGEGTTFWVLLPIKKHKTRSKTPPA